MKAWRIESHGKIDVLQRKEIPTPEPGPMQARIRVDAVALNHLDLWVRNGVPGHRFPLPITPGCDISGRIESFGPGAEEKLKEIGLKTGDPVVLNPAVSCGICRTCLSGFDPLCLRYGIFGEHFDGGCADYVVAPVANLIARPSRLTAEEAAAVPIPFITAWGMIFDKAKVKPGELVLVQAGGSGVSVAAIQLLKMIGAEVITTVGDEEKAKQVKALGADHVILYRQEDVRKRVREISETYGKKGCEVVIDHVGADTWPASMKSLAWGGRIVTCGATSGSEINVDLKAVFYKNLSILGSTMASKAELIRILELMEQGKLKPVVHSVLSMEDYPQASQLLEDRKVFGKIVVKNS